MSVKTPRQTVKPKPPPEPLRQPMSTGRKWAIGCAAALAAAMIVYWPALTGGFVFDDVHMHFLLPHPEKLTLWQWIRGARPLTDFSYWVNYKLDGTQPFGYHLVNLLLHVFTSLLVFLISGKILEMAAVEKRRRWLTAGFCGAIFLLHPLQTEAVAYVAQRAECLSVALAFAAWTLFLYRPENAIGWRTTAGVLLLFGASVGAKEHVAVLPLVILVTDYYWNPGFSLAGVRRNWRLYVPFLAGILAVAAFLYTYLAHEPTVGFHMKEFTWYQYLFTQCRVLFLYLRLFFLPVGQSADYFIALSRTPLEHGAIIGMLALAATTVAAIVWRKRFPIASYGFFVALIFFLPTSSIMPVKDLATERRLYLPMIGLLLMTAEAVVRVKWAERQLAGVLAAIVVMAGVMTWNRSQVWNNSLALWTDTVEKSPEKARAHFGLGVADYNAGRYEDAVRQYALVKGPEYANDGGFYSNWALALTNAGHFEQAIQIARKSVQLSPTAANYAQLAECLVFAGQAQPALEMLDRAEKVDSGYEPLYIMRGDILKELGPKDAACAAFRKAQSLDPNDSSAAKGLAMTGCAAAH